MTQNQSTQSQGGVSTDSHRSSCSTLCIDGAECKKGKHYVTVEDHTAIVTELLKDKERMDWLADPENKIGNVQLPSEVVLGNMHSLRDAIDESMLFPNL